MRLKIIALAFAVALLMLTSLALFGKAGTAEAIVDPFTPADECNTPAIPVGVQAVQNGGIDPPGPENDGVNNPAGVGAPVPANNPASPLNPGDPPGNEQGSSNCNAQQP